MGWAVAADSARQMSTDNHTSQGIGPGIDVGYLVAAWDRGGRNYFPGQAVISVLRYFN